MTRWTGAELVVRALEDEGIGFAFGIPGTHNLELYDALAGSAVRPILVTDEQSAGFMADGLWRASGAMGCLNLVPGAGLTHALSGIAEAFMDGVPMLVLACGIRRDRPMAYQLHAIDQLAVAAPVTKGQFRAGGDDLYATLRQACALARAGTPGPVLVEVPVDLYLTRHPGPGPGPFLGPPAPLAPPAVLDRAAAWLRQDGPVLIYAGLGCAGATAELVELAERLGAPVATTISAKGVFPEHHPRFLWNGFGSAAPPFAREAAARCRRILAIGCRFGEVATGSYGIELPGPLLHVDINPEVLGRNYPAELAVAADARAFLQGVLDRLPATAGPAPDPALAAGHAAQQAPPAPGAKVTPARLLQGLARTLGPETIYTTDSGNGTFLAMEHLRLDAPGRFLAPVDFSCMGYAVPAALGAKLGRPEAPVVALAGDGAFLMTGLEALSAASLGLAVAIVVLRDGELAQIAQFQRTAFNRPTLCALPDYHLEALAAGVGIEYLALPDDRAMDAVLARMQAILAEGRPVIVEAGVDYSQPTHFTRGVVRSTLNRLAWPDRLRFLARALGRRIFPA